MIASFLGISGRLRRASLVPNVLYVIRKYAVGIAIIHINVFHLWILNGCRVKAS